MKHQALLVAILGQEGDAKSHGFLRRMRIDDAAVDTDLAPVGSCDSEYHFGDLGATGADKAEKTQDLAGTHVEAHIVDKDRAGQVADAKDGLADLGLLLWKEGTRLSADHIANGLLDCQLGDRTGRDVLA